MTTGRRVRMLIARYRRDRRLPPVVSQLLRETAAASVRDRAARAGAAIRPAVGDGPCSVRMRARRWRVAPPPDDSWSNTAGAQAAPVATALADLDVFLVGRSGPSAVLGLVDDCRGAAWDALCARLGEPGWLAELTIGHSTRQVAVAARARRKALAAHTWRVFRPRAWGSRAIGDETGVEVSFWALGTSGQLERIGVRDTERFDPRSLVTAEHLDGHEFPGRSAFPVDRSLDRFGEPVDVVVTWVDSSDPAWQASFLEWRDDPDRRTPEALHAGRFRSRDELRFVLRSVWAHAAWVRNIYIVTNGQRPTWLADHPRVRVVPHSEILPADALPTFNSHAIEAALHHIEGLAEHFVYFNDDMFIGRTLTPEAFYTPNGLARAFLSGARVPGYTDDSTIAIDTGAVRGAQLLERDFHRVPARKPHHAPYALRKSVMCDIEREYADDVARTQHSRFRSPTDVSTAAALAHHVGIATGRAVASPTSTAYVHLESGRLAWHLRRLWLTRRFDSFCLNETSSADGVDPDVERRVAGFLQAYFPVAAPWELP